MKHKDWEASFRLEKAEQEAAALPEAPPEAETVPTPEEDGRFEQIAELSPVAAILEQRRALEEAVYRRASQLPNAPSNRMSLLGAIRFLRSREVIDAHTSAILDDLRNVGNTAAHGLGAYGLTKEDAMRYRKLVTQVIDRLSFY